MLVDNIFLFGALALSASAAKASDGFERVRCDQPILAALIGARSNNEAVVRTEARRKAIGLKDLGADEIDDGINTINWLICGREFVVLDVRDVWTDAIEMPSHSSEAPAFSAATCELRGEKIAGAAFVGVFDASISRGAKTWPIKAAWRIDSKKGKFVPLEKDATCSTEGIFTADKPK
jgi:hypothetical protein